MDNPVLKWRRYFSIAGLCFAISWLPTSCSVYDRGLLDGGQASGGSDGASSGDANATDATLAGDAATADGAMPDGAGTKCVPKAETCDGKDNDCDGKTDEAEADQACKLANASSECEKGECVISQCAYGFGNCDGKASNGCETPLNTLANCGACDNDCEALDNVAAARCEEGLCYISSCKTLYDDCDADPDNGCETSLASMENCGACGKACSGASCPKGVCLSDCGAGSGNGDCDGNPGNGCETPLNTVTDCGDCFVKCQFPNAEASCESGICEFVQCNSGYADCDKNQSNGCEKALNSITDCGGCDVKCEFANAWASCDTGTCAFVECKSGWADCKNGLSDGCETSLTSMDNCGACGSACAKTLCAGGKCTLVPCAAGLADCDLTDTSCAYALNTLENCVMCGETCALDNATEDCFSGTCEIDTCDDGYGDCDGQAYNGCERSLKTLTDCGDCGAACGFDNAGASCGTGTCEFVSCNEGYQDCNSDLKDGCEAHLGTVEHCGGCNDACVGAPHAAAACNSGACAIGQCDSGWGDCTADPGCETQLGTDTNCTACGDSCVGLANVQTASCDSSSGCVIQCQTGYASCDNKVSTGCEAYTVEDNSNCGKCGTRCTLGQRCRNSKCGW